MAVRPSCLRLLSPSSQWLCASHLQSISYHIFGTNRLNQLRVVATRTPNFIGQCWQRLGLPWLMLSKLRPYVCGAIYYFYCQLLSDWSATHVDLDLAPPSRSRDAEDIWYDSLRRESSRSCKMNRRDVYSYVDRTLLFLSTRPWVCGVSPPLWQPVFLDHSTRSGRSYNPSDCVPITQPTIMFGRIKFIWM